MPQDKRSNGHSPASGQRRDSSDAASGSRGGGAKKSWAGTRKPAADSRKREPVARPAGSGRGQGSRRTEEGPARLPGSHQEQGPMRARQPRPAIPPEVTGSELDRSVRAELNGLHPASAKEVAQRLVLAGELLDEDPETAYLHAAAARERAARIGCVREAVGLAAYRTGRFAEALAELRTARRLTGSNVHLPVIADCERGLGRPERALEVARSAEAKQLDVAGRIELLIVAAGARADLGQHDASVVMLQIPQLKATQRAPWVARLRSAYADALADVGRDAEARHWLELAAEADEDGATGAAERLAELDGVVFLDDEEDEADAGQGAVRSDGPEAGGDRETQATVDVQEPADVHEPA